MKRVALAVVFVVWAPAEGCIVVEGERIRAADLAAERPLFGALDPELVLGFAPAPGLRRVFSPAELARLARRHGLIEVLPEAVCVERAAERLTEERLLEAMRRNLGEGVRIEIVDYIRQGVPKGVLEFPPAGLAGVPAESGGAVLWRGRVRTPEGRSAPVWARVKLAVSRWAAVARRNLMAGKSVEAEDFEERQMEVFPALAPRLVRTEQLRGAVLRRRVRAGEVLTLEAVRLPLEVERGDEVEVEVEVGRARLRLAAQAETAGRRGESVLVRNVETGRRFKAVVEGRGRLAVRLEQGRGAAR